jgi:hypothetical protein
VGLGGQGCGHLGIDLDPDALDLGDDDGSSGGRTGSGGAGAGAETSTGGAQATGGEDNLGGGWGNGDGGWGNGGDWRGDGGWGNGDGGWGNGGSELGSGGASAAAACSSGTFGALALIDTLEVTGDKWGPTITADRLTLYFALGVTTTEKIYRSTRTAKDQPFGPATEVTELNAIARQGTPFVNHDDTRIYFFRQPTPDQSSRDLWFASRNSPAEAFSKLTALVGLNSSYREHLAWLTPDERTVYFASARGTSSAETDIWMATRPMATGPFAALTLVGGLDSGLSEDQSPSLTPDQLTMFFTTDYSTSLDVYSATRATTSDAFGTPTREDGLSSSSDDTNVNLSPDGREIFISSARSGSQELWVATRECD